VVGARGDEDRLAFLDRDLLVLDFQRAAAFEHDVDLVVLVRRLVVGLRGDEHVDADLEARRAVDDLVAAVGRREPLLHRADVERAHSASLSLERGGSAEGLSARYDSAPPMHGSSRSAVAARPTPKNVPTSRPGGQSPRPARRLRGGTTR